MVTLGRSTAAKALPAGRVRMTHTSIRLLGMLLLIGTLSGCATLAGDSTQKLNIQTIDAEGRIVEGMSCHVSNASANYVGVTPMFDMAWPLWSRRCKLCSSRSRGATGGRRFRKGVFRPAAPAHRAARASPSRTLGSFPTTASMAGAKPVTAPGSG